MSTPFNVTIPGDDQEGPGLAAFEVADTKEIRIWCNGRVVDIPWDMLLRLSGKVQAYHKDLRRQRVTCHECGRKFNAYFSLKGWVECPACDEKHWFGKANRKFIQWRAMQQIFDAKKKGLDSDL